MRLSAATESVDRSLVWVRIAVAGALTLVAVRALPADGAVGIITFVGAVVVMLVGLGERRLRPIAGALWSSVVVIGVDIAVTVTLVLTYDIGLTDPGAIVLALALFEAAIRHGLLGAILAWLAVSIAMVVPLALDWDGSRIGLSEPIAYLALLLLVTLPAAHLCEYLVDLIDRYVTAHRVAERRATLLAQVLDASGAVVAAKTPQLIDDVLVARLAALQPGDWRFIDPDDLQTHTGSVAPIDPDGVALVRESDAVTITVSISGDAKRVVHGTVSRAPDVLTVEAIEMVCAQARISHRTSWLHTRARLDADFWARRARTDELTGVLNRTGFTEAAASLLTPSLTQRLAVVYIDLDGFKLVNDVHGHEIGDQVLRDVAATIRDGYPGAITARLGGDEFAMVLRLDTHEGLAYVLADLRGRFDRLSRVGAGNRLDFGVSVGATIINPGDEMDLARALHAADIAMYEQKRHRKALSDATPPGAMARR